MRMAVTPEQRAWCSSLRSSCSMMAMEGMPMPCCKAREARRHARRPRAPHGVLQREADEDSGTRGPRNHFRRCAELCPPPRA